MRYLTTAAVIMLAAAPADAAETMGPGRPNVLLIMTDDQGYGDLGFHGNDKIDTPVLDQLATESVRFDRFFVCPYCTPTRAAVMTGRYPLRTGAAAVTRGLETVRSEEVTIAELLRSAGYATGCFGKWHIGEHYPSHPNGQGFDEFFGDLRHFGIEVVLDHPPGRFLNPTLAVELGAARRVNRSNLAHRLSPRCWARRGR